ncbi:hypothetical protein PV325_008117 [Microctonus aethiopoides]|nr:hypothetical protein PV325_008117 [Microctonus aethiopoides]
MKNIVHSTLQAQSNENTIKEICKEKNIKNNNEKSYDAVRQIPDNQCTTPRRSSSPNGDNSTDGAIILNNHNSSSSIQQKFRIPKSVIFDKYETMTKDKIQEKV